MLELVEIVWMDHSTMEGWCDVQDALSFCNPQLSTIGYLLYEDEEKYVISNTKSVDKEHQGYKQIFNSLFSILKGTVSTITYLEVDDGTDTVCS